MFKQKPTKLISVKRASLLAIPVIVIVASLFTYIGRPNEAEAATSSTLNYQARLLTAAGKVVPDGNYNVEFKLYNVDSGGTALWTETRTNGNRVRTVNGYMTVNLGSITPFGTSINWDQELWLTMNVGGTAVSPSWDGEMNPRLKLTSVPYAFTAGSLVGGSGANRTVLDAGTPSGSNLIHLPAESGTLCIQNSTNCGFASSTGSGNYIQNGTSLQTANFYIQSAATNSVGAIIRGASGQTSSLLQLLDGTTGLTVAQFTNNGYLHLGSDSASLARAGQIVLHDGTASNTFTGTITSPSSFSANRTITLPDESGTICVQNSANCGFALSSGSGNYIQNGTTVQTANYAIRSTATNAVTAVIQGANGQTSDIFQVQLWDGSTGSNAFSVDRDGFVSAGYGLAAAGGAVQLNVGSDNNTFLNTGGSTGTIFIGDGTANLSINSTGLDVSTAGALSGITTITTSGDINGQTISSTANFTGTLSVQGNTTIGDAIASDTLTLNAVLQGSTPMVFEGSTIDANETNFAITDPTADRTITFGDETGTVCLQNSANCGFALSSGSGNYIQNGTTVQDGANFAIRSAATGSIGAVIQGANGQTADLLRLQTWNGTTATTVFGVGNTGNITATGTYNTNTFTSSALQFGAAGTATISSAASQALTITANAASTWSTSSGNLSIQAQGNLNIGNGGGQTINIGTNNAAHTITLGNQGATGSQSIVIGSTGNANNAVSIESGSTGTINIGNAATAHTINIGSGAAVQGITIGSTTSTSSTTIQGGTGGSALNLTTGTNGNINMTTSGIGDINLTSTDTIIAKASNSFQIQNASNSPLLYVDTANGRVGVGGQATFSKFEVIGGDAAVYNNGNNPRLVLGDSTAGGENGYLQWDSTNNYFRIESVGTNGLKVNDNYIAIGNIFPDQPLKVANGSTMLHQINTTGATYFKTSTNTTAAFQIQDASNNNLFNVDTSNGWVISNGSTSPANLLENPSFEANGAFTASGWNHSSAGSISGSGTPHHGKNEFVYAATGSQLILSSYKYLSVQPGDQFYAEVWYKTSNSASGAASFSFTWYDKDKNNIGSSSASNFNSANTSYTLATVTGTVPANGVYLRLTTGINPGATGNWHFDDYYMMKMSSQSPQLFKNTSNSTTSFRIQNAAADSILTVDTSNAEVELGEASDTTGKIVFFNSSNANGVTLQSGTTSGSYTLTLPTSLGSAGDCLKDSGSGVLQFTACGNLSGTLQGAYNSSIGGTTPEIIVDSSRAGVDIQDVSTPGSSLGANPIFAVRGQATASTLGAKIFAVQGNGRVGIGNITPGYTLDVDGDINISSGSSYRINGTAICTSAGCTPVTNSTAYIQNQNAGQQASSNFWISGTGRADTALQSPLIDTGSAVALNIGTTNATAINLNKNTVVAAGRTLTVNGTTLLQPSVDSTTALNVKNTSNGNLFTVDTQNSRVGINLGGNAVPSSTLHVEGSLRLSGTITESFVTPVGSNVPTKINIPLFDPGAFGQIIAFGLPSGAQTTARAISLFDARTVAHQPTIGVFAPNENNLVGFSWEGSNTNAYLKTTGGNLVLRSNTTDIMTLLSGGNVGVGVSPSYKLDVAGDMNISSGSVYRINGTAICSSTGCTPASGSANYIQNQSASQQASSSFWISSNGRIDGTLTTSNITTASGALTLQSANNTINITGNITHAGVQPASTTGNGTAGGSSSFAAAAGGNTTGTTGQTAGSGGSIFIDGGAGGTAPSGSANGWGGNVFIAGGAPGAGAGSGGFRGNVILQGTAGTVGIGTFSPSGSYKLDVAGSAKFDGGVSTNNVTSISGNLILQAATNVISLGGSDTLTANGGFTVQSGTNSSLTVNANGTGILNLGTNATSGRTINIGATGSQANTSTVNIGNSTGAAQTISIGSTNGASTTTIQGGTGGINLVTNSASSTIVARTNGNNTTGFQVQNSGGTAVINVDTTNQRFGVGTVTPNEKLQVAGGINIGNTVLNNAGTIRWSGSDFEGYNGTSWISLSNSILTTTPVVSKRKATNETVNNSSAFQADDELFFNIGANETWSFRFTVHAISGTTPDFRVRVAAPSGATCVYGVGDIEGAVSNGNNGCSVSSGSLPGSGQDEVYMVYGTVVNGATPGAVTLEWAQNTTTASDTTVYAGSSVDATRSVGGSGTAQAFIQGGNSFGATAVLGTNDGQALQVRTNGTTRMTISSAGNTTLSNGTTGVSLQINHNNSTANILNLNNNSSNIFTVNANGDLMIDGIADSATAFQIVDGSGTALLTYDTFDGALELYGTGTNFGGSRIFFGDNQWAYIGEYGTTDTDELQVYGNAGIHFGTSSGVDTMYLHGTTLTLNGTAMIDSMGIGGNTPTEALTVTGNFNVRSTGSLTKQYRFRTSGGALDFEGAGADMYLSVWSGVGFTGTQYTHIIMDDASESMRFPSIPTISSSQGTVCINSTSRQIFRHTGTSCSTSSARYKNSINNIPESMGLEVIMALRPVTYKYNEGDGGREIGMIAEEVNNILPEVVAYDDQGRPNSINYEFMVASLVKGVQQQQAQINGIQGQVNQMRVDIDSLRRGIWNGGLVSNDTTFNGLVTFNKGVKFTSDATFEGNVAFKKKVTYSQDAAGTITIPKGETKIEVKFAEPYAQVPRIALSADQFVTLKVSDKTVDGFTINLRVPYTEDVIVDWVATQTEAVAANP